MVVNVATHQRQHLTLNVNVHLEEQVAQSQTIAERVWLNDAQACRVVTAHHLVVFVFTHQRQHPTLNVNVHLEEQVAQS
jgi:hypothetical protein